MNTALKLLVEFKNNLIKEREAAINSFNKKIKEIETSIEELSGKKVWEVEAETVYDDENPDYIKGSIEN